MQQLPRRVAPSVPNTRKELDIKLQTDVTAVDDMSVAAASCLTTASSRATKMETINTRGGSARQISRMTKPRTGRGAVGDLRMPRWTERSGAMKI